MYKAPEVVARAGIASGNVQYPGITQPLLVNEFRTPTTCDGTALSICPSLDRRAVTPWWTIDRSLVTPQGFEIRQCLAKIVSFYEGAVKKL